MTYSKTEVARALEPRKNHISVQRPSQPTQMINLLPYNGFNLKENLSNDKIDDGNCIQIHGKEYLFFDHITSDAEAESYYKTLQDAWLQQKGDNESMDPTTT